MRRHGDCHGKRQRNLCVATSKPARCVAVKGTAGTMLNAVAAVGSAAPAGGPVGSAADTTLVASTGWWAFALYLAVAALVAAGVVVASTAAAVVRRPRRPGRD